MTWLPSIFFLSAFGGLAALVLFFVVHRFIKHINLDEHQMFLDAMLSIVGTLISILLGLLVAAALDHYRVLEQAVASEAANASQIFRLSAGLPKDTQAEVRRLCKEYVVGVLHDEWPAMAKSEDSEKVSRVYAELVQSIVMYSPQTNGETNVHNALIGAVQEMGDYRRQRLLELRASGKQKLMPVLLMCSAIVLVFAFLYGRRGALFHGAIICLVAVALTANLGLIHLLSSPFAGEWAIRPKPFEYSSDLLDQLEADSELQKFMREKQK